VDLGSTPVTGGTANVSFDVPTGPGGGEIRLVAQPSKTTVTIPVATADPAASTVTATAGSMTYGTDGSVDVTVTPASATGTVQLLDGHTIVGEGTLSDGKATVTVPGDALEPGDHSLAVAYLGDALTAPSQGTVDVVVAKAASTTSAAADPATVKVKRGTSSVSVTVSADGATPTGDVTALVDGAVAGTATLANGKAVIAVGPFATVGTKTVEIRYAGDDHVSGSQASTSVEVVKARPRLKVGHGPRVVVAGKTRAVLNISATVDGQPLAGRLRIDLPGDKHLTVRLAKGVAHVRLPQFVHAGTKWVRVSYLGSDTVEASRVTETIKVVKKK
jgi:5'-nucleotidase